MPKKKKVSVTDRKSPGRPSPVTKPKGYVLSVRSRNVAEQGVTTSPVLSGLSSVIASQASGPVRRKNLNINQGLLDKARSVLGVRTETEAVEIGLGAILELAEFQSEMIAGFDRLMNTGGLVHDESEVLDFAGFVGTARVSRRRKR